MPNNDLPDKLPGLDIKTGLNRIGGVRDSYLKILVKFSKNHEHIQVDLDNCLLTGDREGAQKLAHALRGVSGNIGADDLQRAAGELEEVLRENRRKEWKTKTNAVDGFLAVVLDSIETIVSKYQTPAPANGTEKRRVDFKQATLLARDLGSAIASYNADAATIFGELSEILRGVGLTAEMDAVGSYIEKYDYDGARDALRVLTSAINSKLP